MRRAVSIVLTDVERQTMQSWARSRTLPARLVTRAKIVLLTGEGKQNNDIATKLGLDRSVVARWRTRFAEDRLDGLAKERGNRGRKAHKRRHWARTIVEVTLHTTPKYATHWSTRTLAEHLGIDKSMVQRVWKAHNLQPHRVETFKLSNDPRFIEKLVDVVGL